MASYATVGSVGWFGAVPVVTAVVLWIAVLAGVASPLGRLVSENTARSNAIVQSTGGANQEGTELPCVCAAAPGLRALPR